MQENEERKHGANENHKSKIESSAVKDNGKVTDLMLYFPYKIHNQYCSSTLRITTKGCADTVKWMQMKHTHPPISVDSSPWKTNLFGSASLRWHSFDWNCKSLSQG